MQEKVQNLRIFSNVEHRVVLIISGLVLQPMAQSTFHWLEGRSQHQTASEGFQ